MELDWNEIIKSKKGNFYLVGSRERDIDSFEDKIPQNSGKVVTKIIRGQRCTTKESLFQEFAAALQFPYYFGHNWDAFDECIADLYWISASNYVFLITNFNKVLVNSTKDLNIFLDMLKDAMSQWDKDDQFRKATPFNIIFHCELEHKDKCKEILKKENIQVLERDLKPFDDIK